MENDERMERRDDREALELRPETSSGISLWKIVGGTMLLLAATAVIVSLPDIKRYYKISTM